MTPSNRTSSAGRTHATMTSDGGVPLPSSMPSSIMMGLFDVYASVNPETARITAEMRTATRLSEIVMRIASFLRMVFPVGQVGVGEQYGIVHGRPGCTVLIIR